MGQILEIDLDSLARSWGEADTFRVLAELERGWHFRKFKARERQGELHRRLAESRAIPEVGYCDMQVDATVLHYWGEREGYECWDDEGFIRDFKRDNPEVRVKYQAPAVVILNPWGQPARERGAA